MNSTTTPGGHWGGYFLKELTMDPLGMGWANCFGTHNELTMDPLGILVFAPSARHFDWDKRVHVDSLISHTTLTSLPEFITTPALSTIVPTSRIKLGQPSFQTSPMHTWSSRQGSPVSWHNQKRWSQYKFFLSHYSMSLALFTAAQCWWYSNRLRDGHISTQPDRLSKHYPSALWSSQLLSFSPHCRDPCFGLGLLLATSLWVSAAECSGSGESTVSPSWSKLDASRCVLLAHFY